MNIFKKLTISMILLAACFMIKPAFATTATVDIDKILVEYTKAKNAADYFRGQEQVLQNIIIEGQQKIKATNSPVEKKNLEATYEKKLQTQAEKMKAEQIKKLQEIETDIYAAINKINNGKYDLILKKGATVYCQNDITAEVLKRLNNSVISK